MNEKLTGDQFSFRLLKVGGWCGSFGPRRVQDWDFFDKMVAELRAHIRKVKQLKTKPVDFEF